jgi:hypothetical protein
VATIRTLVAEAGMTNNDIAEGRKLLLACLAAPQDYNASDTQDAKAQRAAVAEIDEWDEPNFARIEAALRRHFPDVADYVFRDLSPSTGSAAVQGVATLLGRLDALDQGSDPQRQATSKEDKAAVEFLASRKLDTTERARLKKLVDIALGPTAALPDPDQGLVISNRKRALSELKAWFDEWATAARTVIKKRSYLIRLGLASRKSSQGPKEPKES